jgi:hypothetical protein
VRKGGLSTDSESLYFRSDTAIEIPPASRSLPELSSESRSSNPPAAPGRPISPPDPEGFRHLLKKESWRSTDRHLTEALRGTRRELFHRTLIDLQKIQGEFIDGLTDCGARQTAVQKVIDGLSAQLRPLRRQGLAEQRESAGIAHVVLRLHKKKEKLKWRDIDFNLQRTVRFSDFLKQLERECEGEILPSIDIEWFRKSFPPPNPQIKRIEQHCAVLRARMRPLAPLPPGTGDSLFDLMHPLTKTGQIIIRFEEKLHLLSYPELTSIVQRLKQKGNPIDIESLLFDLAWARMPFPFGVTSLRTQGTTRVMVSDLFPAVIADTALDKKWAFMRFEILNGASWPFQTAVDMIWEMMIQTNPFEIARVYWRVIEEVSRCTERMLVEQGQRVEDVEVDFDSLFPLIMICVFAFGIEEWMQVATYALSFMEHSTADAQLAFAMTYLEGLVTQILALDTQELRRKAETMTACRVAVSPS